jgi:Phasin protein
MTTNSYDSAFDMAKQAFAPFADTFKSFQDKVQVPEAARDFVRRAATDGTARAETVFAGAEKATVAIQTAVVEQIDETAKITRNIQQAMLEDAQAFFAGIEKLSQAQSLSDAFQIQSDMVRARTDVAVSRARATADYLGERFATGAKTAQENISKVVSLNAKAA